MADKKVYGAAGADWDNCLKNGLLEDLLPVVSNPHATIAPKSSLKSLGKVPSRYYDGKVGGIARWTEHVTTVAEVTAWRRQPDYGICVQTRHLVAVDCDIEDQELAARIREMVDEHIPGLATRTRGSYKFLCAFKVAGDIGKRIIKTRLGNIELLARGQQFIYAGAHPSGSRYEWLPAEPAFFEVSLDVLDKLWSGLHEAFGVEDAPMGLVSSAPRSTIRTEAVNNDPIAQHIYTQGLDLNTNSEGRIDITCPWEDGHSTGQAGDTSTSYWPAHTGGFAGGGFKCLHASCGSRSKADFLDGIGYREDSLEDFDPVLVSGLVDPVAATGAEVESDFDPEPSDATTVVEADRQTPAVAPQAVDPYALIDWDDFSRRPRPPYRIKGLLPEAGLAVMFGAPGSGKTFAALEIAMSVASGTPWRGFKTRRGSVVYLAAEGQGGFALRLQAYKEFHNPEHAALKVLAAQPNFLHVDDIKRVMVACVKVPDLALIVVDTLAQVTPGANENASEDMGKLIKHCGALHSKTGAMVLLIHHSGKDAAKGARGHSSLNGAADVMLEVVRDGDHRCLTVVKQKDGDDSAEFPFRLNVVKLGIDEDGDPITSCVVAHNNEDPRKAKMPTAKNQRYAHQALLNSLEVGGDAVAFNDLVVATVALMPEGDGSRDNRRAVATRDIKKLIEKGHMEWADAGQGSVRFPSGDDEIDFDNIT